MTVSLETLLHQLRAILDSIPFIEYQAYQPPIIDGDLHRRKADAIPGMRIFKDSVKREVQVLEQFLASRDNARDSDISTNASYLIAVWNEIMAAPPPIVAVGKIFEAPVGQTKHASAPRKSKQKRRGVKVDVVADEGRSWIRVNTIKNSRLLAEFHELDSYLTDSDVEDDDGGGGNEGEEGGFDPLISQDNSLLQMARLLVAASVMPVPGTNEHPRVTLRLTRLEASASPVGGTAETDADANARTWIMQTVSDLKKMGIEVEFGERDFRTLLSERPTDTVPLPLIAASSLSPTERINLDLSMLIALISDISHAKLPSTPAGAWHRFRTSGNTNTEASNEARSSSASDADADTDKINIMDGGTGMGEHARALAMQCIHEMEQALIPTLVDTLRGASLLERAEFWVTPAARDRCVQIVDKVGGPAERRRVRGLFGASDAEAAGNEDAPHGGREMFWRDSRYAASYFPSFPPVHIHQPGAAKDVQSTSSIPFWGLLIQTCDHLLSDDPANQPRPRPHPSAQQQPYKVRSMARADVVPGGGGAKLTVHTVESLLRGACAGMTTLTANKASIKAVLREMRSQRRPASSGDAANASVAAVRSDEGEHKGGSSLAAAVWVVEPRSLAEDMRADHVDYEDREGTC